MTMNHIDYFKLQAKNLFRDYKTRPPKYFDIESIFFDFEWEDDENFTLMKAQHLIAEMLGFYKWTELLKASEAELEMARLLFDNQHKIHVEDWKMYIAGVEHDHKKTYDLEGRIEIFKLVFANREGHHSPFGDYRLTKQNPR